MLKKGAKEARESTLKTIFSVFVVNKLEIFGLGIFALILGPELFSTHSSPHRGQPAGWLSVG
jgi:hypothetical protein